jgi:ornithine cyclodeaminase/alanine dehydrogenase
MLVLSRSDLEKSLSMPDVIDAVEHAFVLHAQKKSVMPIRSMTQTNNGLLLTMPAALEDETQSALALKAVSVYADNAKQNLPAIHAAVMLFNAQTGQPLALMEGGYLTALRTGAVSGVAAKYLARDDSKTLAIIGCGVQSYFQAWAIACVRSIQQIKLFNRTIEKAEQLAEKLQRELNINTQICQTNEDAIRDSDIVVTATNSTTPVFDSQHLSPKSTVISVGAFTPEMREVDDALIQSAKIYVDDVDAALAEAGDLLIPINAGLIDESAIYSDLGNVVTNQKDARTDDDGLIFFKSVGLAIEDVATAQLAYDQAKKLNLGTVVPF